MFTFAALANRFEFDLVAHRLDGTRLRADEDDPRRFQLGRKGRPFGEEAIAGMHRLGTCRLGGRHDRVGHEVALRRRRRPDAHRLVRHLDVQGIAVGVRIDGDRGDPHPLGGLHHPAGDLAAVGDEDFVEHQGVPRRPCLFLWTSPAPLK